MSETYQKLAFTHPIVVLKSGLKNNWMKKMDRVNRPLEEKRSGEATNQDSHCHRYYTCLSILLATFNYRVRGTCVAARAFHVRIAR